LEVALYGLDAPAKQQIVASAMLGAALSEEELDRRLNRLTVAEGGRDRRMVGGREAKGNE